MKTPIDIINTLYKAGAEEVGYMNYSCHGCPFTPVLKTRSFNWLTFKYNVYCLLQQDKKSMSPY